MDPDELFTLRNYFFLGCYQMAINEASSVNALSEQTRVDKDFFMYRAYVGLGNCRMVLDEVRADASCFGAMTLTRTAPH